MNKPRDGPATTFTPDPYVAPLSQIQPNEQGDRFGIVLVANWPPNISFTRPYPRFISKIKSCFKEEDLITGHSSTSTSLETAPPAVYLYPPQHLHITIATFMPFTASPPTDIDLYAKSCTKVVENAFSRPDWPKHSFCVELDRIQVGERAGIILWKECRNDDNANDGGIQDINPVITQMRHIIQEEYDKLYNMDPSALNHRQSSIPGIIHSTFLRFGRSPVTDGETVQRRLQENFGKDQNSGEDCGFGKVTVDGLKLVIERTPYMHIPCDENHVLITCDFLH